MKIMIIKFIDPEVTLFILANIFVAIVFFAGRDAEAASAGTTLQVATQVSAEVPCTPENSSYSEVCMDLDDEVIVVQNVETPSLWDRFINWLF